MYLTKTWRRSAAAAATLPLLLALAACGGDSGSDNESDSGSDSSETADASEGTESTESTESPDDDADDSDDPAEGDEIDPKEFADDLADDSDDIDSATMTMTTTTQGMEMDADVQLDYSTDPPAMAMTMTVPEQGDVEMVMVDNVLYMKSPQMGNKFLQMDVADAASQGVNTNTDPLDMSQAFSKGVEKVVYLGEEDIAGTTTEKYEITVDTKQLPKEQQSQGLPKQLVYHLWLDDEDRMKQMEIEQEAATVVMTIDEWNADVSIKAPPANQVQKMP